jgi:hypothetical protein
VPKNDTLALPYVVPYDFDYTGVVNASYAIPDEQFGNTTVVERVYRGNPCTMDELMIAINIFKEKKERIMYYINNFALLYPKTKKTVSNYIIEFYNTIENKNSIRAIFKPAKN